MKYFKLLMFAFLLFTGADALAQRYDPYTGTYTYGGVDRSIDRQRSAPSTKKKKDQKDKEKEMDFAQHMTDYLVKELKLDDFQKAAVKVIYDEHKDEIMELSTSDLPSAALKDKARNLSDKIDAKIMKLLSKDQAATYQKMIDERKY